MRYLVLALMIVLLPLRGWAVDAMATQMASTAIGIQTGTAGTHAMTATSASEHQNSSSEDLQARADCHEQLAGSSGDIYPVENEHCGTCQACQACHTVALSPSPFEVMASFVSPQLRPTRAAAFTSVASALGQKPPIP